MSVPGHDVETATTVVAPHTEGRYRLVAKPDEITHIVCCRDISWRKTFCGEDGTDINPAAEIICTMCMAEAESMRPGWISDAGVVCPVDGNLCPDVDEIDQRIAREVG